MTRPIRTAVFPVAGLGTRFLPATRSIPKEMLPLVDGGHSSRGMHRPDRRSRLPPACCGESTGRHLNVATPPWTHPGLRDSRQALSGDVHRFRRIMRGS